MLLIFDVESSGLFDFKAPPDASHQPRLVEMAAALYYEMEPQIIAQQISLVVKPEGFEIPEAASNIHGITTETALAIGLPTQVVLAAFNGLMRVCTASAAFNYQYDENVLRGEFLRLGKPHRFGGLIQGTQRKQERIDVMLDAKDHCKIPGKYNDWKWPSLAEAHQHFFGQPVDQAHEAMADVKATAKIHFEMIRLEREQKK